MKHIYLFILVLVSAAFTASASSAVQQADSAYNKEDYKAAIALYNDAISQSGPTSDIYYNLGNAYYRDNKIGKAILYYERALTLDPSNSDARINLNFVRTRMEDIPEDDSSFLSNLHSDITAAMSPDAWAIVALVLFIIVLATVAIYIFSSNITVRKVGFFGGIFITLIFIYVTIIASQSANAPFNHNTAIVIVPTTNLSSAPRSTHSQTEKVVPIHEGTKITITDSLSTPDDPNVGKWYDVKINNSTRAWLNADDVEKI